MSDALSPYEQQAAPTQKPVSVPASGGFILRKVIWVVALAVMGLIAVNGILSFELQTGAPQQAALAAWSSFQVITIYTITRGLDELTRGKNGV